MTNVEVELAVLATEMEGLREQHQKQATETNLKLDALMTMQHAQNNWMQQNSSIPAKVDELYIHHQRQKGMVHAARIFTATVGGIIAVIAHNVIGWFNR